MMSMTVHGNIKHPNGSLRAVYDSIEDRDSAGVVMSGLRAGATNHRGSLPGRLNNTMPLGELLRCKGRAEVGVVLAHQIDHRARGSRTASVPEVTSVPMPSAGETATDSLFARLMRPLPR